MTVAAGDRAPAVWARNQDGELVEVDMGGPVVLYFYPKDDTPGCTTEAEQFDEELDTYHEAGVTVYGISLDGVDSHKAFAEKYGIEFDLLADPDGEIAAAYEVDTSRGVAERTTFVVEDGRIHAAYTGVNPDGHARDVMLDLIDAGVVDLEW